MHSLFLLSIVALPLYFILSRAFSLRRRIQIAKESGLFYVVLPFDPFYRPWLITQRAFLPYLHKLPERWIQPWIIFMDIEWVYKTRYTVFEKLQTDTILTVTPTTFNFFTADPSAISQITTRRNDFPKPIWMYKSVDLFGKNVVTTEGLHWRAHRKITAPPFTEQNNHLVWGESLHQAKCMLASWVGPDGKGNKTIDDIGSDTMRLSLHVISRAGFGVRLLWPGIEDAKGKEGSDGISSGGVSANHKLSYTDALQSLLHNILWVMLVPHWLLSKSRSASPQPVYR